MSTENDFCNFDIRLSGKGSFNVQNAIHGNRNTIGKFWGKIIYAMS